MRVLTADIGGTKVAVGRFAEGALEGCEVFPTERERGGEAVLSRLIETLSAMDPRPDRIGLSTIGIPRRGHDTVSSANIPGWRSLRVIETLEERFGCPVHAINDVKAAALGEAVVGAGAGVSDVLFVNLGTGIACAAVRDGRVALGAHGAAGEVGFWLTRPEDEPDAATDTMPLEERIGGRGLEARWSALAGRRLRAFDVAQSQDPGMQRLWSEAVREVAMHVANMAIAFDPTMIVLGGGMAQDDRMVHGVRQMVAKACLYPPAVVCGRLGNRAGLWGARIWAESDEPREP